MCTYHDEAVPTAIPEGEQKVSSGEVLEFVPSLALLSGNVHIKHLFRELGRDAPESFHSFVGRYKYLTCTALEDEHLDGTVLVRFYDQEEVRMPRGWLRQRPAGPSNGTP